MAASPKITIDSTYGVPEHLSKAAAAREYKSAWRVRTPIWQRIIALGALGGVAGAIGIALALSLIGVGVITLMLLEAAIG